MAVLAAQCFKPGLTLAWTVCFLPLAGCASDGLQSSPAPAQLQAKSAGTAITSASEPGLLPWIAGTYAAGDTASEYVAFLAGADPVVVFEQQDYGEYGRARVVHHYTDGVLTRFEKWSRVLSMSGTNAPTDGWYETTMVLTFDGGHFVAGEKTVNGKLAEPDEHELRGALRTAAAMKERVAAQLAAREDDAPIEKSRRGGL